MTLHEYMESLRQKTVAVLGIGVSNTPLVQLLLRSGIRVTACDKRTREQLGTLADELKQAGCTLRLGPDYLEGLHEDVIFRTPGLRPDVPELLEAKAHGAVITSEMEAFFAVCPCPILGVTGSDGKTTTASVIAELLKAEGRRVWLGGNIGRPLLADAEQMTPDDLAAVEKLRAERYATWEWNYGRSPACTMLRRRRVDGCGLIEAYITVEHGLISVVAFKGDFFSAEEPEDLAARFVGHTPDCAGYTAALDGVEAARYFAGLQADELIDILCEG